MERSRGGVCRTGGPFPIAFRCAAASWFKLTHPAWQEARYRLAIGVGLWNHRHIRHRRPLTESFVLPPKIGGTFHASPNCT